LSTSLLIKKQKCVYCLINDLLT